MTEVRIDISYNAGDGYWRVSSPDVPGLHLAGRTMQESVRDLGPILDDLMAHNRNKLILADDRLIVALDVDSVLTAYGVVRELGDAVSFYKIGPHLFEEGLFKFISELKDAGKKVFLDFKTADIGYTVARMINHAADLRVNFISVMGGHSTVEAAVRHRGGRAFPKILAVTLLTDQDAFDMQREYHTPLTLTEFVCKRAMAAATAGADGVVCSPKEITHVREATESINPKLLIVTPGIRPAEPTIVDGHKRTGTPRSAIKDGASHIIVGRPIVLAANRLEAARKIIAEINANKTT